MSDLGVALGGVGTDWARALVVTRGGQRGPRPEPGVTLRGPGQPAVSVTEATLSPALDQEARALGIRIHHVEASQLVSRSGDFQDGEVKVFRLVRDEHAAPADPLPPRIDLGGTSTSSGGSGKGGRKKKGRARRK